MKRKTSIIILGIETSCDETAAAVIRATSYPPASPKLSFGGRGKPCLPAGRLQATSFHILSHIILSQIRIHKKYGGIVPEVAARNHIRNIIPVIDHAMHEAKILPKDIDRIAVTRGPGLITSLMVGVETAKALAFAWNKPIAGINHLKGHIYTAFLQSRKFPISNFQFPIIALIVSGGHTELVLMKNTRNMKKVGQTLDDAAGEAFDKVAKILGLPYPGGPEISKLAEKGRPDAFDFPRPMIASKDLNFSFSGLKTAVLYKFQNQQPTTKNLQPTTYNLQPNIAASFQQAVVDVLALKTLKAAKQYKVRAVILTGGVAANKELRRQMKEAFDQQHISLIVPDIKLCTDNAVMAAMAGYFEKPIPWKLLTADPNLEI